MKKDVTYIIIQASSGRSTKWTHSHPTNNNNNNNNNKLPFRRLRTRQRDQVREKQCTEKSEYKSKRVLIGVNKRMVSS
jgi:hypothetical protein